MFAEHYAVGLHADRFGSHDLVGDAVLQHSVLVNSGFVRERVLAHDGLVGLHHHAGDVRERLARTEKLLGRHAVFVGHQVFAHAQRHYYLFERRVAGALAYAVDGAFDLARSGGDGGQRVGHGQPQVVVAVHADRRAIDVGHARFKRLNDVRVFGRYRVADGVRDVDDGSPFVYHRGDDLAEIIQIAARRVFGGELDVVGEAFRQPHGLAGHLQNLFAVLLQLVLQVNVGGGDEGVNARASGV